MALDDSTLVIQGVDFIHTAPPGTPKPADPAAPPAPWVDQGHSSEDGLSITFEMNRTRRRT